MKVTPALQWITLFSLSVVLLALAAVSICHAQENRIGAQSTAKNGQNNNSLSSETLAITSDAARSFALLAEHELPELDRRPTLGEWLNLHGATEGWRTSTEPKGLECVTLIKMETLPSGMKVKRAVSFYPPAPPSPAVLPTLTGEQLMDSTCTLAAVSLETRAPTPEIAQAIAQIVQQQFTTTYGESLGMKGVVFWGSGFCGGAARWIHNAEIVSAYEPRTGLDPTTATQFVPGGPAASILARLPAVHALEHQECCTLKTYYYRPIENTEFHRAVAMAGVNPALSQNMESLYEQVFRTSASSEQAHQPGAANWQQSVVPVLRDWLAALKPLASEQQAAGLFAADLLLSNTYDIDGAPVGAPKNSALRSELQELGAVFQPDELSGTDDQNRWQSYTRNWLEQAQSLDPNGKVMQMIMLASLARGSCNYQDKTVLDAVHRAIQEGEQLLNEGLDPSTAAQVHFMVGDAYSDIVALSEGADPDAGLDPAQFHNEVEPGRAKALEHFRAGLAVDNLSPNAKDAWLHYWRLSAGLLPDTRYVCGGD
jgi:hypothetical protein